MTDKAALVLEGTITVDGKTRPVSVNAMGRSEALELIGREIDLASSGEAEENWREPRSPSFDELKKQPNQS